MRVVAVPRPPPSPVVGHPVVRYAHHTTAWPQLFWLVRRDSFSSFYSFVATVPQHVAIGAAASIISCIHPKDSSVTNLAIDGDTCHTAPSKDLAPDRQRRVRGQCQALPFMALGDQIEQHRCFCLPRRTSLRSSMIGKPKRSGLTISARHRAAGRHFTRSPVRVKWARYPRSTAHCHSLHGALVPTPGGPNESRPALFD